MFEKSACRFAIAELEYNPENYQIILYGVHNHQTEIVYILGLV